MPVLVSEKKKKKKKHKKKKKKQEITSHGSNGALVSSLSANKIGVKSE